MMRVGSTLCAPGTQDRKCLAQYATVRMGGFWQRERESNKTKGVSACIGDRAMWGSWVKKECKRVPAVTHCRRSCRVGP